MLQEPAKRFSEGNSLADSGLFTPSQRGLTIGLVLVLVVVAFEGLAVTTIMPVTVRELHGLALYAWSFSGFMLGSLVGTVAAGDYTARRGAVFAFTAALAVFAGGLLTCGTANSMTMFIAGRVVEGLGTGAVRSLTWSAINWHTRHAITYGWARRCPAPTLCRLWWGQPRPESSSNSGVGGWSSYHCCPLYPSRYG